VGAGKILNIRGRPDGHNRHILYISADIGVIIGGARTPAPPMHRSQVRRHVVLSVELLLAHGARVGLALEVGGDVVPVEVGGMGVGVVADLAAVGVTVLDAEAADADGRGSVPAHPADAAGLVKVGQLRLNLLLELVGH